MKKNFVFFQQKTLAFLTTLGLFLTLMTHQSCNDKKDDGQEKKTDPIVKDAGDPAAAAATQGPYAVLKIEKQQLVDAFSNPAQKILIQFSDANTATSSINAIIYGAKKDNKKTSGPFTLLPANGTVLNTTGMVNLGNNELTIKQVKDLLNINGQITLGNAQVLYFYPKKDADNYIRYYVSTVLLEEVQAQINYPAVGVDTKPSPPADPCDPCI